MDANSLQVLEWPAVVDHLVACASTAHGRDRCRQIEILTDERDVAEHLELTQEARDLIAMTGGPSLGGIHDLRAHLRRVEQGGVLDPHALSEIADTLEASRRVADLLKSHADDFPHLGELAVPLAPLPELTREIRRCLEPGGQVRDNASPDLFRIRATIAKLQQAIKTEVNRLLARLGEYLQESLVTVRGDRYVLPVRAEHKSRVPGLVHDQSATGQTLFIEPMALVELNNDLQKARLDERDEIARILEHLTEWVGEHLWEARGTDEGLAEIDFVLARAKLSDRWNGYKPRLAEPGAGFRFYQARHPLLVEARLNDATRPVVPIDLVVDAPALVVTGPNTGGKTVALKTLGLATLLTQAGIHPPVGMGSEAHVFRSVFADIGDEQSIQQSLSTFSGHMRNLVRVLGQADSHSLVLLDELGAGTDPAEGAAIARTVIEELIRRGARLAATTHLADLKLLPYQIPGVQNASVEFDPTTMQPTYRLLIGVPGHSNAIAIARRLGFPEALADRARRYLEVAADEAARLVGELSKDRSAAATSRANADEALRIAREMQAEYEARLAAWHEERKRMRQEAQAELRRAIEEAEREVKDVIAELKGNRTGQGAQVAGDRLRKLKERLRPEEPRRSAPTRIQVGDTLYLPRLGQNGIVQSPPDRAGELVLSVGLLKVTAKLTEVEKARGPAPETGKAGKRERRPRFEPPDRPAARQRAGAGPAMTLRHPSRELDLRGMMVHEALPAVERFLDDAFANNLDCVYIIHGGGTGALRRAVREYLPTLPYARSFRPGAHGEGGDGVTVVNLG